MTQCNLVLDSLLEEQTGHLINVPDGVKILSLELGRHGVDEMSFIRLAHRNNGIRQVLERFLALGFLPYRQHAGVVYFVADWHVGQFWHRVKNGDFGVSEDGLIFSIEEPKLVSVPCTKLVVVFSSMAADPFEPSLTRYFEQNYKSLRKFLTGDVAILRIADIGGAVGGFYSNTTRRPDEMNAIQRLISAVREDFRVSPDRTVLYGASKGGSGALLHGLLGNYRVISVDPIVDDQYYEKKHKDSHFTGGNIFLERKIDLFDRIRRENVDNMSHSVVVITSPKSPQFDHISNLVESFPREKITTIESLHPEILDHPDVSAKTMPYIPALINGLDLDLWPAPGKHSISA